MWSGNNCYSGKKIGEYFVLLINYYETNDMTKIKEWIRNNCVDGI